MKRKMTVGLFLSSALLCPALGAFELFFNQTDSVRFPSLEKMIHFQLVDVTGDFLDEIVVLFPHSYYIYSPSSQTILSSDTAEAGLIFEAIRVGDVNGDNQLDIVLIDYQRQIWVRSGVFFPTRTVVDKAEWTGVGGTGETTILINDFDGNGSAEISIARLAFDDPGWIPPEMDEYFSGIIEVIDPATWSTLWHRNSAFSVFWQEFASSEMQLSVDFVGDGIREIIVWGDCWLNTSTRVNDSWERTWRDWSEMGVLGSDGSVLFEYRHFGGECPFVRGGNFDQNSQGDEIVMVVSGPSPAPSVYTPTSTWSMYGLAMEAGAVITKWGAPLGESKPQAVCKLSFPQTSLLMSIGSQWKHFSGSDGHLSGFSHGLKIAETEEGHLTSNGNSHLEVVQVSGNSAIIFGADITTQVPNSPPLLPASNRLEQNYPNPFNPETTIRFSLDAKCVVTLLVYNVLGRKVRTLISTTLSAGNHEKSWDGRDDEGRVVASGLYFYRLKSDTQILTRKMVLVR